MLREENLYQQENNRSFQEAFFKQMSDTLDPFGDLNSTMRIIATNLPEITAALNKVQPEATKRNKKGQFLKGKK